VQVGGEKKGKERERETNKANGGKDAIQSSVHWSNAKFRVSKKFTPYMYERREYRNSKRKNLRRPIMNPGVIWVTKTLSRLPWYRMRMGSRL
jgi:hypothetical protein